MACPFALMLLANLNTSSQSCRCTSEMNKSNEEIATGALEIEKAQEAMTVGCSEMTKSVE